MTTAAQVIALARGEIGYVEQGGPHGNDGNVTKYGSWYGINPAYWCAMFVSYIFWSAGLPLPAQTRKGFAYCVDEETEILTRRGWVHEWELCDDDEALAFDGATETSVWTPILAVHRLPAERRRMLSIESRTHSSLTTEDHRWLVKRTRGRKAGRWEWRTSRGGFRQGDQLPNGVPHADFPQDAKWSDAFVELVAWFWTEGHILRGRGGKANGGVNICQSAAVNSGYCARIRRCLAAVFGAERPSLMSGEERLTPGWRETSYATGKVDWFLNAPAGRALLDVAPDRVPSFDFLLTLTEAQLRLFIDVSLMADGTVERGGRRTLAQKSERATDAFQFACTLAGIGATKHKSPSDQVHKVRLSTNRPYTRLDKAQKQWVEHDGLVWCVTTALGTWFSRRRGIVTLTGNCPAGINWFKGMGLWTPLGKGGFAPGDVVFYDEGLLNGKAATGVAGHVEIIVDPRAHDVDAIGGNTSSGSGSVANGGGVYERTRPLQWCLGVGHPQYAAGPAPAPAPGPASAGAPAWPGRMLTLTTPHVHGPDVTQLQQKMNEWGSKLGVDGDFGQATSDAVRWWQAAFGLHVDGVVGRETWSSFFSR